MASDLVAVLSELAAELDELGVRYAVGGSLASGAWGEPRSTHDVDLLVELTEDQAQALVARVRDRFHVDEAAFIEAVRERRSFNLIHLGHYEKIDVFVAGDTVLDRAQLATAVLLGLGSPDSPELPVTSAELIILRKLDWFRRGGEVSDRQWRDVIAIVRVQGERLRHEEIDRLAAEAGLTDLWARVRSEA